MNPDYVSQQQTIRNDRRNEFPNLMIIPEIHSLNGTGFERYNNRLGTTGNFA